MNKANQLELDKAILLISMGDEVITGIACRTLATIQRCGTASDTKTILSVIKQHGLSHYFYTEDHCLVVIADHAAGHARRTIAIASV